MPSMRRLADYFFSRRLLIISTSLREPDSFQAVVPSMAAVSIVNECAKERAFDLDLRPHLVRLKVRSSFEKDPFALDIRTPPQKEIAQLGRVVIVAECRVKPEKELAAGREVSLQIA